MNDRTHLPPAVRKQAELADEIAAQLKNTSQETLNTEREAIPIKEELAINPEVAPLAKHEPNDDRENDLNYERNKYRVLDGKYKAEVPRLSKENKELKQTIQELNAKAENQPAQSVGANDVLAQFSKEDRDEYGDDLIELVSKVTGQMASKLPPEIAEIQQHMAEVNDDKDTDKKAEHLQRQDAYLAEVTRGMPDWKAINASPAWINWLGGLDPFTSIKRQAALDDAQRSLNAQQIIHIFNEFKKTQPSSNVPGNKIQPNSIASSPSLDETQPVTREFIRAFYEDKRKGVYKGKTEEADAIEGQINHAVQAGKVRG